MRKPAPPPQPAKGLRAYTVPYAAKGGDGPRVYIVSPSYWSDYNAPGAMDCATVANCVLLVGQAVARLVFESPDRPLQRLLSKPNDWQSRTDFMSGLVHSVLMYGNGYMHRPEIGASLLDPGTVTVHPGPTGRPRYHAGGRVYGTREVVHFRDLTAPDNKGGVGSFGHVVKSRLKPLWPRGVRAHGGRPADQYHVPEGNQRQRRGGDPGRRRRGQGAPGRGAKGN